MRNVKKSKKEIQLLNKEEKISQVPTIELVKEEEPVKSEKILISFDAYFSKLMREKTHVLLHHKAPMRQFAKANGLKDTASIEEFDRVFEQY